MAARRAGQQAPARAVNPRPPFPLPLARQLVKIRLTLAGRGVGAWRSPGPEFAGRDATSAGRALARGLDLDLDLDAREVALDL